VRELVRLRALGSCLAIAAAVATLGCAKMLRGYAATESPEVAHPPPESAQWSAPAWGGYYALHADFGSLTTDNLATNAVPWKLVASLPDVVPEPFYADGRYGWQPVPGEPLRRFGIIYGARLEGPPGLVQRSAWKDVPVGYARGTVHRSLPAVTLDIASTNCSMCHLGRTWDAAGRPTGGVYWGVPNHSVDFDALITAVTRAILDPRATDEALLAAMARRFPDMSDDEAATYRKYVLPAFKKTVREAQARWGWLHPWRFGGPGFSHGAALLRDALADDKASLAPKDFPPAFVKVPNLFGVTQKRWLLIDGSYAAARPGTAHSRFVDHLIAFLPVFGTAIDRSADQAPRLDKLVSFLETLSPPPFPGRIDAALAARGAPLYQTHCAACHGDRGPDGAYHYPSQRVAVSSIGTDPTRARGIEPDLARRFVETDIGKYEAVAATDTYMPPSLQGVWANAPYFHNGSVPTLWAVLRAEERPTRFLSGGHAFDPKRVGIACEVDPRQHACLYPAGYVPWSEPRLVDTGVPGRSSAGHERPSADLSDDEKWAVLEYLKTL
jgi:mono/diheme cytochrome c family protein